jgi:hypothetical protein
VSVTWAKFEAEFWPASKTTVISAGAAQPALAARAACRELSRSIMVGNWVTSGWFPG